MCLIESNGRRRVYTCLKISIGNTKYNILMFASFQHKRARVKGGKERERGGGAKKERGMNHLSVWFAPVYVGGSARRGREAGELGKKFGNPREEKERKRWKERKREKERKIPLRTNTIPMGIAYFVRHCVHNHSST